MIVLFFYTIAGLVFLGVLYMDKLFGGYETSLRKKSKKGNKSRTNYKY